MKPRFNLSQLQWRPGPISIPEFQEWMNGDDKNWRLVKRNLKRSVYLSKGKVLSDSHIYIKYDHPPNFRDQIKTYLKPKVLREYSVGKMLKKNGVPAIEFIGCGWEGSMGFVLSKSLDDSVPSSEVCNPVKKQKVRREKFFQGLLSILSILLEKKIWHPDIHWDNLLVTESKEGFQFYLVDLYGIRKTRNLDHSQKLSMLAGIGGLKTEIPLNELTFLASQMIKYFDNINTRELLKQLEEQRISRILLHWKKRTQKFLKNSSVCKKIEHGQGFWLLRKNFSDRMAMEVLDRYKSLPENEKKEFPKNDSFFAQTKFKDTTYLVKEYIKIYPPSKLKTAYNPWIHNWRLENGRILTSNHIGWFQEGRRRAFFLYDVSKTVMLEDWLTIGDGKRKLENIIAGLGELLEMLYKLNVFHENLMFSNLVIDEDNILGHPTLGPFHNEDVKFNTKILELHKNYHYHQLIESIPNICKNKEEIIEKIKDLFVTI